ncbi:MAG TPA: hypothetical protein VJA21_11835 [Verrucomicrobiae bacterium]
MPIRINLLAEAQAEEEQRRKDPVKRVIGIGVILVLVMLAWASSLQLKSLMARSELGRLERQIAQRTNEFQQATENSRQLAEATRKLESLHRLACNRLLYGSLLDSLQQIAVNDVRLMRLKTEQTYVMTEATKAKTNATRVIPGKPATATERIVVALDAKDSAVNPGDQVNKFKQAVMESDYFQSALGKTNEVRLTSLSPPQSTGGKPFVLFSLECRYPEQTR